MSNNNKNKSDFGHLARAFSPIVAVLGFALAGCSSISIPLGDNVSKQTPAMTGSVGASVKVEQPLPKALAYSDAAVIGEVAAKEAFKEVADEEIDWVNGATGSVGTWKAGPQVSSDDTGDCRAFGATVTSVQGIHHYSGVACRDAQGHLTVKSLTGNPADAASPLEPEEKA